MTNDESRGADLNVHELTALLQKDFTVDKKQGMNSQRQCCGTCAWLGEKYANGSYKCAYPLPICITDYEDVVLLQGDDCPTYKRRAEPCCGTCEWLGKHQGDGIYECAYPLAACVIECDLVRLTDGTVCAVYKPHTPPDDAQSKKPEQVAG